MAALKEAAEVVVPAAEEVAAAEEIDTKTVIEHVQHEEKHDVIEEKHDVIEEEHKVVEEKPSFNCNAMRDGNQLSSNGPYSSRTETTSAIDRIRKRHESKC